MSSKEALASGATRGAAEVLASSLTIALTDVLSHGVNKVKGMMDKLSDDVLSPKGTMDDSAGVVIKGRYRKYSEEKYSALIRLLNLLTKPIQDDFVVISVGVLVITKTGGESEGRSSQAHASESVVKDNLMLLGIDFDQSETFSGLFEFYDQLVQDFLALEKQGPVSSIQAEQLIKASNFYGDNYPKKRLAGLIMHVKDWEVWKQRLAKIAEHLPQEDLLQITTEIRDMSESAFNRAKQFAEKAWSKSGRTRDAE